MIRLTDILSEKKNEKSKSYDKNKFYEQYLNNLLPEDFKIKRTGNKITVEIKD